MLMDLWYDLALRELAEGDDPMRERIREAEEARRAREEAPEPEGDR